MADSNDKILSVGKNANDTAALVWSVADDLVGCSSVLLVFTG